MFGMTGGGDPELLLHEIAQMKSDIEMLKQKLASVN